MNTDEHGLNSFMEKLLDVIGHDMQDDVINDEVEQIFKTKRLRESDAEFLIAIGKIDEVEAYLLGRADQLDGNHYGSPCFLLQKQWRQKTATLSPA